MKENNPYKLKISFPGNLEYVSPIRKFISEILQVNDYSQKFAYRSEVIIDEVCCNAINYGCNSSDAHVELVCFIFSDRIELQIRDQGGNKEDLERLRIAVKDNEKMRETDLELLGKRGKECLGLEIVRMLSEEISLLIDENNVTTLRVIRRRKDLDKIVN